MALLCTVKQLLLHGLNVCGAVVRGCHGLPGLTGTGLTCSLQAQL